MALEALKQYAAEQNQATQAEIDKLLKNNALKRPTSDEKGKGNIKPLVNKENVIEALQERLAGVYKEYQQNIKTSSQLQTEILKGARAGEDIYSLFLKAVKAISLMTSNTLFYSQIEGDIREFWAAPRASYLPLQGHEKGRVIVLYLPGCIDGSTGLLCIPGGLRPLIASKQTSGTIPRPPP